MSLKNWWVIEDADAAMFVAEDYAYANDINVNTNGWNQHDTNRVDIFHDGNKVIISPDLYREFCQLTGDEDGCIREDDHGRYMFIGGNMYAVIPAES